MEEVYKLEGDAPVQALHAALAATDSSDAAAALRSALEGIVWTPSMRRMYTLLSRCLQHSEPALLVGETGTGKTTVCQLAAALRGQRLHIINCNQHTEASDFLGGFRPTRCCLSHCMLAFNCSRPSNSEHNANSVHSE